MKNGLKETNDSSQQKFKELQRDFKDKIQREMETATDIYYAIWALIVIKSIYSQVLLPLSNNIPYWWAIASGQLDKDYAKRKENEIYEAGDKIVIENVEHGKKMVGAQMNDLKTMIKTGKGPTTQESIQRLTVAMKDMKAKGNVKWYTIVFNLIKMVMLLAGILLSMYWIWFLFYVFLSASRVIVMSKNTGNASAKFKHSYVFMLTQLGILITVLLLHYKQI